MTFLFQQIVSVFFKNSVLYQCTVYSVEHKQCFLYFLFKPHNTSALCRPDNIPRNSQKLLSFQSLLAQNVMHRSHGILLKQDINSPALDEPVTIAEDFEDASPQNQKEQSVRNVGREKCTVPCEMTAKLMQDEKHSWCSMYFNT